MWDSTKQPPPSYQPPTQPHIQGQVYNIPSSAIPTYPAVQVVQQNEGWWSRTQKNKPQANSVGTASLIFISGGMNMAWKLGFSIRPDTYYTLTDHILASWFIGGIIGAIVGAFACNNIPKKFLLKIAGILVTTCGILQLCYPISYEAILASRYINGLAVGLVFPLTLVLVGEEVVKPLRGMNAASVDVMCFSCGIFIQILYTCSWSNNGEDNFQAIQMSGVLNIIYGLIALIMASIFFVESPVFYLARGDEQMALDSLRRLQRPFTITYETYVLLEEHKLYVAESKERTFLKNAVSGLPALVKLCFYRSFMALGFSYFVNFAFTYSAFGTTRVQVFPHVLYALARWLGPLFVAFTLDSKGRKPSMIFGFFICTIFAFIVGGLFDPGNFTDIDSLNIAKYILILFQFFATISMASSSVYLSEAFPLAVKPYYVAIVFIVEMLVQIIIICSKDFYIKNVFHISEYFLTLGALSLVFLALAIYSMPETKFNSLRECLEKFKRINNFRN